MTTTTKTSLAEIEKLTKDFGQEYATLACKVSAMTAEMEQVKQKFIPILRTCVAATSKAKLLLHSTIAAAPELFEKPRTQIFHGIKVGFQKGKGGIEFEDADKVVALIKKQFPGDGALAYLHTTETPDKKMLGLLPVIELKKLGCTVGDTGDVVVIKSTDSEIEKTVSALLKDAAEQN